MFKSSSFFIYSDAQRWYPLKPEWPLGHIELVHGQIRFPRWPNPAYKGFLGAFKSGSNSCAYGQTMKMRQASRVRVALACSLCWWPEVLPRRRPGAPMENPLVELVGSSSFILLPTGVPLSSLNRG